MICWPVPREGAAAFYDCPANQGGKEGSFSPSRWMGWSDSSNGRSLPLITKEALEGRALIDYFQEGDEADLTYRTDTTICETASFE